MTAAKTKETKAETPETTAPTAVQAVNPDAVATPEQTTDITTGDTAEAAAAKQRAEEAAKIEKDNPTDPDKAAEERTDVAEKSAAAVEKGDLPQAVVSDHFQINAHEHFGNPVVDLSLRNYVGPAALTFALAHKDELIKALQELK